MRSSAISNGFNAVNHFHNFTLHSHHLYTVDLCVPPLQVYCDMDLDGGGWTMVMEAGWCNIPNKGHLQPTHMMIAAYHNKNVVWAYRGWFNWNIDHDWTGGVLVEPVQVVDNCPRTDHSLGKPPAPSTNSGDRQLLGIAFDKHSPDKYLVNCDTIHGTFTTLGDCRWANCHPRSSSSMRSTQMSVVIYIR